MEHVLLTAEEEERGKKRKRGTVAVVGTKRLRKMREDDERIVEEARTKKWKPRYAMCIQCEREYDITKNAEPKCRWHPGESLIFFHLPAHLSFFLLLCSFIPFEIRGC